MDADELEMLIDRGEDDRTDRKRSLRVDTPWHKAEFVRDVMAFANGHGARPAYILIGVDDGGGLHDVGNAVPDEATLQQIISSHLDPPVPFSLRRYVVRGVGMAVIEIPPSEERFHVAARDIQEAGDKHLLRRGEVLVRRGTAKMPLKALDSRLLKREYAERHGPQARLDVRFADDALEATPTRARVTPDRIATQFFSHVLFPPPGGRIDFRYHFFPLRFFVHNRGQHQAETVIVDIDFPDDCQAVIAPLDERDRRAWPTWGIRAANRVRIEGDRLVHGDHRRSREVYVRFSRREGRYTLEWTARAGNIAEPVRGRLVVEIPEGLS